MAKDVYEKIDKNKVDLDYMLTFSLGGDLARFSKARRTSHKIKTEEFIDNMWQYIKDNNLINDKKYIGCLYGHICHYYMDLVCHPLIRKIDKLSINVGFKNHTLIEAYLDSYLVSNKLNNRIEKYNTKNLFKGKINKVRKMINNVYYKTYNNKHLSLSYSITKFMYSKIRYLFIIFGKNILINLSNYNKYKDTNKNLDILNENKKICYKDYLGIESNYNFEELYNKSIILAVNRINNLK